MLVGDRSHQPGTGANRPKVMFRESSLRHMVPAGDEPQSRAMTKRDFLLVLLAAPLGLAATGCRSECCAHDHPKAASTAASPAASATPSAAAPAEVQASVARLDPDESVDARFKGCALSCGAGLFVDKSSAKIQPGANVGDLAHCTVSGAVFRVTGASPRRDIGGGRSIFFCCESCAQYFSQHRDEVLAKRGIAASET